MRSFYSLFLLMALTAPNLYAEEVAGETVEGQPDFIDQSKRGAFTGGIEVRPSVELNSGWAHTQNTVEFGYRFSDRLALDYTQYIQTNIFDPNGDWLNLGARGLGGFLRLKFSNVWQNVSKDLSLNYESRVYVPTDYDEASRGMVFAWRHIFSLNKTFNQTFGLTMQNIPIFYAYNKQGFGTKSNLAFENRVYLIPSINFTPKISLSFPILFHFQRTRDYVATATNNNRWTYKLWVWPDLTYEILPKTILGVSFMSDNMILSNLSGFTGDGITHGVAQVILRQNL